MPIKYSERINMPLVGMDNIQFSTRNGLKIAKGYKRVVMTTKGPFIEFSEDSLIKDNIYTPEQQKWRDTNPASPYSELRSRDYCNIKIIRQKRNDTQFDPGMFYISPFDLKSDTIPVLIKPLRRKQS